MSKKKKHILDKIEVVMDKEDLGACNSNIMESPLSRGKKSELPFLFWNSPKILWKLYVRFYSFNEENVTYLNMIYPVSKDNAFLVVRHVFKQPRWRSV